MDNSDQINTIFPHYRVANKFLGILPSITYTLLPNRFQKCQSLCQ